MNEALNTLSQNLNNALPQEFTPPPGVKQFEVCADTGTLPSEACPEKRTHWFAEDRPPLPKEKDLYQKVKLVKGEGKLATQDTPAEAIEEKVFKIYPQQYRQWAEEHGIPQPPKDATETYNRQPTVTIRSPIEGEVLDGMVTIMGSADAPAFTNFTVQYGISHDPGAFSEPFVNNSTPVIDNQLGQWDTQGLDSGPYTLRLAVRDNAGHEYESKVHLFIQHATPTEPQTATPTWTPLPTNTPTNAPPTDTPVVVDTPTNTPEATLAPPVDTPVVVDTPTLLPDTPTPAATEPITSATIITSAGFITATVTVTTPVATP